MFVLSIFALDLTVIFVMSLLFLSFEGFKVQDLKYQLTKNEILNNHLLSALNPKLNEIIQFVNHYSKLHMSFFTFVFHSPHCKQQLLRFFRRHCHNQFIRTMFELTDNSRCFEIFHQILQGYS